MLLKTYSLFMEKWSSLLKKSLWKMSDKLWVIYFIHAKLTKVLYRKSIYII